MTEVPNTTVPEPIPDAELAAILQDISDLETRLQPYARSLTDAQRRALPKMGPDSVDFVQNGQNAIDYSLDYMPRDFDPATFKNAFKLNTQLTPIALRLEALFRNVDDAEMLFGSIAYTDALEIYSDLGPASKKDSALLAFWNAMKVRFDKLRGKRPTPPAA